MSMPAKSMGQFERFGSETLYLTALKVFSIIKGEADKSSSLVANKLSALINWPTPSSVWYSRIIWRSISVHLNQRIWRLPRLRGAQRRGLRGEAGPPQEAGQVFSSCEAEGQALLTLAAYTFRGWHPVVLATIPKLGRQLARKVGRAVVEAQRPAW